MAVGQCQCNIQRRAFGLTPDSEPNRGVSIEGPVVDAASCGNLFDLRPHREEE
jgi:hypothetical protein